MIPECGIDFFLLYKVFVHLLLEMAASLAHY